MKNKLIEIMGMVGVAVLFVSAFLGVWGLIALLMNAFLHVMAGI